MTKEEWEVKCWNLQKENEQLKTQIAELKQSDMVIYNAELLKQIEKMKCCQNCRKRGAVCVAEETQGIFCGENKNKWEMK